MGQACRVARHPSRRGRSCGPGSTITTLGSAGASSLAAAIVRPPYLKWCRSIERITNQPASHAAMQPSSPGNSLQPTLLTPAINLVNHRSRSARQSELCSSMREMCSKRAAHILAPSNRYSPHVTSPCVIASRCMSQAALPELRSASSKRLVADSFSNSLASLFVHLFRWTQSRNQNRSFCL